MNKSTPPNKGNPWTDGDLRIVLETNETKTNKQALAIRFGRVTPKETS